MTVPDTTELQESLLAEVAAADSLDALEAVRVSALGKKGAITAQMKGLGQLDGDARKEAGQALNRVKDAVQAAIGARQAALDSVALEARLASETVDVTLPVRPRVEGHLHPVSQVTEECIAIFGEMGFAVAEGPDIEDDFHNFTALNIPPEHPARQMHDTFYLNAEDGRPAPVLRTHTSPVQIRHLETNPPPVRIVAPGRVYRRDAVDATHSPVFHQVEVLAIDEGLDFSHLRGTVMQFLKAFFGDLPVRFRASYFPFTEPSAEVDVQWRGRWLEVMGCGMVDPAVLEGLGLDPDRWSGFAAGLGVERFCMVRHGIDDIRRLYTSDLRFLDQF